MERKRMGRITENYREHPAVANSDLSMLKRPSRFYEVKFGDGEREDKEAFHLGTLLDLECFNPDKIKEDYILCTAEGPSNTYHVSYVENRLAGMSPVEAYRAQYSTKNKTEDKIAKEAAALEKQYKDYIEFKEEAKGKIEYSTEDSMKVHGMKTSIQEHRAASEMILKEEGGDGVYIFTSYPVSFMLGEVEAKGEIDRLIVDTNTKTVKVIDLKTTGKPIYSFPYSVKRYSYHRQLLVYGQASIEVMLTEGIVDSTEELDEWGWKYYLVAVEKNPPHECRVFQLPRIALEEANEELVELLEQYQWHMENEKWAHKPEYYENDGVEKLEYKPDPSNFINSIIGHAGKN